jgi:hypothetical protein
MVNLNKGKNCIFFTDIGKNKRNLRAALESLFFARFEVIQRGDGDWI